MADPVNTIPKPVRQMLGKGRRGLRRAIMGKGGLTTQSQIDQLRDWLEGLQQLVNSTVNTASEAHRIIVTDSAKNGEHLDLVVDQLWRRLEAADARLASHLQRLEADSGRRIADLEALAARLRTENAAILRLIGHEELIEPTGDAGVDAALPVARMTLFSEVERGSSEVLLEKLRQYVHYFEGATAPIIDLGCGKGDFLSLMKDAGLQAYGVDLDDDAVATAKAAGLDARLENLFEHLAALPDGSLGGAFSSQVVEHLPAETLPKLYEELFRVLASGGRVVIETPNPATFATHVQSFWRDPTHTRPVPQPALEFWARGAGFVSERTVYASPAAESDKLTRVDIDPKDPLLAELVQRFNANAEKLDDLLFGYQDYALVVRKP